jgi:hypothetical protein
MKTAGRGTPNRWAKHVQQPSTWRGRSEQILLIQVGCEARNPAVRGGFFLDFSFQRTYQGLTSYFFFSTMTVPLSFTAASIILLASRLNSIVTPVAKQMGSAWGSILESKQWAVLHRPSKPAAVLGQVGFGTYLSGFPIA